MGKHIDVAIIGAGPYGLSIAAHLRAASVEFRIFGKPMESWRNHMPPGMLLKSGPSASNIFDPGAKFTLQDFCSQRGIFYEDVPRLPLETFVSYGDAFQAQFVPNVEPKLLTALARVEGGFQAAFDDGEAITARRVILALGVHPFKHIPAIVNRLPAECRSHSSDYGPLDALSNKRVVVLGAGSSATDLAVLLHEKGAAVTLVGRRKELKFAPRPSTGASTLRRWARPLKQLARPGSDIGSGWLLKICADAPGAIYALPERWRWKLMHSTLGPSGHSSVRDRMAGKFPVLLERHLQSAEYGRNQVVLRVQAPDGSTQNLEADHVVSASGYKIDMARLGFFDPRLLSAIRMTEGSPVLSDRYETSVPGLYVVGPAATLSFGPVNRFVCGAKYPARTLMRHLSEKSTGRARSALTPIRAPAE